MDSGSGGGPPGYGEPPGGFGHPAQGYGHPYYGAPPGGPMAPYPGAHPQAGFAPQPSAPSNYKTVGILMLVSGIKSAIISFALILTLIWVCVGFFWVLTLVGAIFEIVVGAIIMSGKHTMHARTMAILGLVNAVLCGNIIGIVLEAIALSQLAKPEVEHYLAHGR